MSTVGFPVAPPGTQWRLHQTEPAGNSYKHAQTWPAISSLEGRQDVEQMRLKSITFSRWGGNDQDFSGVKVTNKADQSSELMGTERHDWETAQIKELPIQKIHIFEKNDAYMRGFRIHYRNGETTLINSENGIDKGVIEFEETDILVGLTCLCTAANELKPRGFGFTVMRR